MKAVEGMRRYDDSFAQSKFEELFIDGKFGSTVDDLNETIKRKRFFH